MPFPVGRKLASLTFNSDALAERTDLAHRIVVVLNEWNKLEGTLGVLLGTLMGTRYSVAVQALASVVNFGARLDVIKAAAKAGKPGHSDEVGALTKRLRDRALERNRVAHGCWAVSAQYPDRLILCPRDHIEFAAAKGAEGADPSFNILEAIRPHLQLWSDRCFRDLEKRIADENAAVITLNNKIATETA